MVGKKFSFNIVVTKEKTKNGFVFVAEDVLTDIVSEGDSYEESVENLKEALAIHLERTPFIRKLVEQEQVCPPIFTRIYL